MKTKSLRKFAFSFLVVPLLLLSVVSTLAVTDTGTNDKGRKPSFISNTLLVKLTPQSRAHLKVAGEEVNPASTGLPSLDAICRDHDVRNFRSVVTAGGHRDAAAPIHAWHKLTLPGDEQQIELVAQSTDETLNVIASGAEPLGRLMAKLKQDPNVESVSLDYVVRAQFVPNDPYYSTPYPTSHPGSISQWAP